MNTNVPATAMTLRPLTATHINFTNVPWFHNIATKDMCLFSHHKNKAVEPKI